jgi:hypothetical protein
MTRLFTGASLVRVDQAAENRSSPDPPVLGIRDGGFWAWRAAAAGPMRTLRGGMRRILGEHPAEVSLAEDQHHPVGEFRPDSQHEAFGEAVGSRAAGLGS